MNVSLNSELSAYVAERVKSGDYSSPDHVVEEGLQLLKKLEQQDRASLDELRQKIAVGVAQADRGELEDVDEDIMNRIRAAGQKILTAGQKKSG